ncbi:MAG: hypothetical protein ACXQTS_04670 [Candidatus Methanospirareceae archaeon]
MTWVQIPAAPLIDPVKNPEVTFYGTWVNEEGMGICLWEAPSPETVKEIVHRCEEEKRKIGFG